MITLQKIQFLGIAYLLSLFTLAGQETYIKSFLLYDESTQEYGTTIYCEKNEIYISVGSVCDGKNCVKYAKLNNTGDLVWKIKHPWTDEGNRNAILCHNGELLLSSHERWSSPNVSFHLTRISKDSGDSLAHYTYNYDSLSTEGIASDGILMYKNKYLLYGESREKKDGIPTGLIQWVNLKGEQIKLTKYRLPDNALVINRLEDLQPDSTGHLVFITTYRKDNKEYHVIRKLDSLGNVVKDIYIYANRSIKEIPKLAVDTRGNYIIAHRKRDENLTSYKQILCVDTSGNYLWAYDILDVISGNQYFIDKIRVTGDGGAIISGYIQGRDLQDLIYNDAFVLKLDKNGQKEWEKRINFYDHKDTLLDFCSLLDVVPLDSGGYAAVGYHIYSNLPRITDLLLVQLDKNGCVTGYDCSVDTFIVRTPIVSVPDENVDKTDIMVYPNPFSDHFTVSNLSADIYRISLSDMMGNLVYKQLINHDNESLIIDTFNWPNGLYIISAMDKYGNILHSRKVLKM